TDTSSLVNHIAYMASSSAPHIAYALMGDDPIDAINHMMSFLTSVIASRYPATNNQLRTSSNPRQQATINNAGSLSNQFRGGRILFRLVRQDRLHQDKEEHQANKGSLCVTTAKARVTCPSSAYKKANQGQKLNGSARGWFERLPANNIDEWSDLREAFAAIYSVRRACFKEPHEITKIVRIANESLMVFKERWIMETGFIIGVPEVMKISSFLDSVKSPELAKRFSNKVPTTVNEMMVRLDDFVQSKEAYARTKRPKDELRDLHHKVSLPALKRDGRPYRGTRLGDARRNDNRSN
nr:reverse transcriptase domain-containing protein [Tanacetum cinerariifolium]